MAPGSVDSSRKHCEVELEKLRRQLMSYNEEEQMVIRELELTKTMRKAEETQKEYSSNESFYLNPHQINFDGPSQLSSSKNSTMQKVQEACDRVDKDFSHGIVNLQLSQEKCKSAWEQAEELSSNVDETSSIIEYKD